MGYLRNSGRLLLICLGLITFTGCDFSPSEVTQFFSQLKNEWSALKSIVNGEALPKPSPSVKPELTEEAFKLAAAKNAKANAEIMHEIFKVVLMREPRNQTELANWVDVLNQGATFEGVYNGLTHSSDYRKLETVNIGASAEAIQVFGEELAILEVELPVPTEFDANSASPLPVLDQGANGPDTTTANGTTLEIDFPRSSPTPKGNVIPTPSSTPNIRPLAEKYSKQFVGASIFTLKRVIGDEAIKTIDALDQYPGKVALWYSKWVVRICQRKVDFGLALRNKADEGFHYKWALETSVDRIKWEVLNRLHRVLNEANRQKQ